MASTAKWWRVWKREFCGAIRKDLTSTEGQQALERPEAVATPKVDEIDIFDPETFARTLTVAETVSMMEQALAASNPPAYLVVRAYEIYKQVRDDCARTDSARGAEYLRLVNLGVPLCNRWYAVWRQAEIELQAAQDLLHRAVPDARWSDLSPAEHWQWILLGLKLARDARDRRRTKYDTAVDLARTRAGESWKRLGGAGRAGLTLRVLSGLSARPRVRVIHRPGLGRRWWLCESGGLEHECLGFGPRPEAAYADWKSRMLEDAITHETLA